MLSKKVPLRSLLVFIFISLLLMAGCKRDESPGVLVRAAHTADEKLAAGQLRTVQRAEESYKAINNRYGSMQELIDRGDLTRDPSGHLSYKFTLTASETSFHCDAVPQVYGTSGRYSFYIDDRNELRGGDHKGSPASASDEVITWN